MASQWLWGKEISLVYSRHSQGSLRTAMIFKIEVANLGGELEI